MHSQKIRKLDIDLPRQLPYDQRPWLVAGLLIAFILILMIAFAYIGYLKKKTSLPEVQENTFLLPVNSCITLVAYNASGYP